jgi:hypothetical protein
MDLGLRVANLSVRSTNMRESPPKKFLVLGLGDSPPGTQLVGRENIVCGSLLSPPLHELQHVVGLKTVALPDHFAVHESDGITRNVEGVHESSLDGHDPVPDEAIEDAVSAPVQNLDQSTVRRPEAIPADWNL